MGLFKKLFKFSEQSYSQTQNALLEIARFTPVPFESETKDNDGSIVRNDVVFRERCDLFIEKHEKPTDAKKNYGVGGIRISAGIFWMPSVGDLRRLVVNKAGTLKAGSASKSIANDDTAKKDKTSRTETVLKNIVGEARSMHSDDLVVKNGDIVQAASQFNTLEFPGPSTIPEEGIEGYLYDHTQGPACALACFAGTAYRNYLVPLSSASSLPTNGSSAGASRGQTKERQLNGMDRVEEYLIQKYSFPSCPWKVQNGYVDVSSANDLGRLNSLLSESANGKLGDEIISRVRIGIQEDTEVTDILLKTHGGQVDPTSKVGRKFVTQTYNSAISIGYSRYPKSLWTPIARIVLDATYEATLLVGLLKTIEAIQKQQEQPTIFLTKVGGGVFGNDDDWIRESITKAIDRVHGLQCGIGLDIRVVHFGQLDPRYRELEGRWVGYTTTITSS